MRRDLVPDGIGFTGKQFVHGHGFLFAGAAAHVRADTFGSEILGGAMQPAGENGMIHKSRCLLRERDKYSLRDILGELGIAHHPQSGGVDEVNVASHEFGKSGLRPVLGVINQKLLICEAVHLYDSTRRARKRTGNNGLESGKLFETGIGGFQLLNFCVCRAKFAKWSQSSNAPDSCECKAARAVTGNSDMRSS